MTDSAPRVPGEIQCQWCAAKGDCEPLAIFIEETISAEFDDLSGTSSDTIADFRKRIILDHKKFIISFLDAVEESVFKTIEDGDDFPGYKIVIGNSQRKWNEKAEKWLKKTLKDKAFQEPKLINITNATKLLPAKTSLDNYTSKPLGKPTLVKDSDTRPSIKPEAISDLFDDDDS